MAEARMKMLSAQSQPSTTIASLDYQGNPSNAGSTNPAVSADGRYVAFSSSGSSMVGLNQPPNTGISNVYVRDTVAPSTTAVSDVTCTTSQGLCGSGTASISGDGRYVAFDSLNANLVPGGTSGTWQIYLRDRSTGTISRLSVTTGGAQGNGDSTNPIISPDGAYVAFKSAATNLVSGTDNNNATDVFVRNVSGASTKRISLSSSGGDSNGASYLGYAAGGNAFSSDDHYMVFYSNASNLVATDANGTKADVFLRDLTANTSSLLDVTSTGTQADADAYGGSISSDGRDVAFVSAASNLGFLTPDCGGGTLCSEVYVKDRTTGSVTLASVELEGTPLGTHGTGGGADGSAPMISASGRYVFYASSNADIVSNDTNTIADTFTFDQQTLFTSRTDVSSTGGQASNSTGSYARYPVGSPDARYVALEGKLYGLVTPEPSQPYQVYLRFNPNPSVPPGQSLGACGLCGEALAGQPVDSSGHSRSIVGEPVNLANGSFYDSWGDATMPNIGIAFDFTRSYNSADTTPAQSTPPAGGTAEDQPIPMSQGWTSAYNVYVRQYDWSGDLVLHTGDGQQVIFVKQANGTFLGGAGVRDALIKNGDATYTVTRHDLVKYQFDSNGNITSMKDRNNQGLTFSYTSGHITSISGNGVWTVTLGYTSGRLTSTSVPPSRSVSYHYNASNLLDQVTDLLSHLIKYTYTTSADAPQPPNLLKTITDQNNNVTTQNTYGADGRVTGQIDARNHTLSYTWNPQTQTATYTDARGKLWTYTYSNGTLIQIKDPLGGTTNYGYDSDLNGSTVTDGRGYTITYIYDSSGNLTQENDPSPLGYQENWTYDGNNNLSTFVDGRSPRRSTLYGYDAAGNLTCVTLPSSTPAASCAATPSNVKTTYGRDPSGTGLMWSVTDPNGNSTNFRYNTKGELSTTTTQLGYVTKMCYDAGGRMTSKVDPRGTEACGAGGSFTWIYTYDAANHLKSVKDPLLNTTSLNYDSDGNVINKTDANSHVTRYEYDHANNLTCVIAPTTSKTTCATAPSTSKTTYSYDNNDDVQGRTDSNSHTWSWSYDDASRLQSGTSPNSLAWSYSYWPNGLLHVKTLPSGSLTYDYDVLSRLASITYSNTPTTPNVTYQYDANGNRTQMSDGTGTVGYIYDDTNRMTSATRGSDVFSYLYYAGGQLKQVTYPDSTVIGYQYDSDERLCTVTLGGLTTSCSSPLSNTTGYTYDAAKNLTSKTYPSANGYVSTLAYDDADRLTSVTNAKSGTTLSSFSFGSLDGVGNPRSLSAYLNGATTTTNYTYDNLDRLTGACNFTGCSGQGLTGLGYTYDPVGDRLTQITFGSPNVTTTYAYNPDDKLCWAYVGTSSNGCSSPPAGATIYTFEANGNETGAGTATYAYDLENRMTSASVGGATTTYAYDGDGNRLSATTSGATTGYLWDTNETLPLLALERSGSTTLRDYSYGAGLNSMATGGFNYFYLQDAYSNVANVTSSSGTAEWTYANDPFGTASVTQNDPMAPTNVMRFSGQLLDAATSLYYLRARVYDPSLGRFLEIDPMPSNPADPYTATYAYSADGPTVFSDPSGQLPGFLKAIGHFFSEGYRDWQTGAESYPWTQYVGWPLIAVGSAGTICLAASPECAKYMSDLLDKLSSSAPEAAAVAGECTISDIENEFGVQFDSHGLLAMEERGISPEEVRDAMRGFTFAYEHDGLWKIGYYNADTNVFVARSGNTILTVFNPSAGFRYVQNLLGEKP